MVNIQIKGKILNFLGKDYNVTIKKSVSMKEYANRIFIWKKDGCGTEKFYFKKWSIPKFRNLITISKELIILKNTIKKIDFLF